MKIALLMGKALTFLLGVWAGAMAVSSCSGTTYGPLSGIVVLSAFMLMTVLTHEVGHAIAALLVRWKVIVISVGRLAVHVHNRQVVFSNKVKIEDCGGWVFGAPFERQLCTLRRRAIFTLGGPIANFFQGLIFLTIAGQISGEHYPSRFKPELALASFGAIGLMYFVMSIVPATSSNSGRKNDGAKLIALRNPEFQDTVPYPILLLSMMLKCNVRLRDLPEWMLDEMLANVDRGPQFKKAYSELEIGRTLDDEVVNAQLARAKIDAYWTQFDPSNWLRACDAYLATVYERRLHRAEEMVAQIGLPSTVPQLENAVKAALAMFKSDYQTAKLHLDRMDKLTAEASPYRNLTFRDIRRQIENIVPCPPRPSPN